MGWDILETFKAKINTENKTLELPHTIIPFIDNKNVNFYNMKQVFSDSLSVTKKFPPKSPQKIKAIKQYPVPNSPKKVKQFTSLCSYNRRFVEGFAKIARPLYQLQCKKVPFIWGPKEQQAFETLRDMLCTEPILIAPNINKPFYISVDASDFALGAILEQKMNNKMHPVAYASRTSKGAELRYSTNDKELLAIIFVKDQFQSYIYGKHFTIHTDHLPLKYLFETKKLELRFNRFKTELRGSDFTIIHRKGTLNPELPRKELYDLADDQDNESNIANI